MGRLNTIFNNCSSLNFDLIVSTPEIQFSNEKYKENDNLYRDSVDYIKCNSKTEIIIKQEMEFIEIDFDKWQDTFRNIRKWLLNIVDNKLKFSDDLSFFYLVKKVELDTPTREAIRNGKFNVTFYCDSYQYLEDGKARINLPSTLNNGYEECYPDIRIEGEGICTFYINSNKFIVNVSENINIDSKNRKSFRDDGTNVNTTLSGHYSKMKLKKGVNTFSISSGFNAYIIPNWRCR